MAPYPIKICPNCKREYQCTGWHQKYCPDCWPEVRRKQTAEWILSHHKQKAAVDRAWVVAHPERAVAHKTKYYVNHKSEANARSKAWPLANPDKQKIAQKKQHAKRRTLGFNPLNSPFDGCEGHHINLSDVIYIPKVMHRSICHNVFTGRNIDKINALAGRFLTEDWT